MFTQCSKCETVFRLSAEALRTAGGQVRCGRCGEVFNALSRLAEDVTLFTKGESPLFLESRAEEILESSASVAPAASATAHTESPGAEPAAAEPVTAQPEVAHHAAVHPEVAHPEAAHPEAATPPDPHPAEPVVGPDLPPGVEIAELTFLEPIDEDLAAETSLEFTLPPSDLDRVFIETRPSPLQQLSADGPRGEWHEPATIQSKSPLAAAEPPSAHPEVPAAPAGPATAHPESPAAPAGPAVAHPESPAAPAGPATAHPESPTAPAGPAVAHPESPAAPAGPAVAHPESPAAPAGPATAHPESPAAPAGPTAAHPESPRAPAAPPTAHLESPAPSRPSAARPSSEPPQGTVLDDPIMAQLLAVPATAAPAKPALRVVEVRREMLSSYAQAESPQIDARHARLPYAAWLTAAIALGLLLVFQVVRGNGGWFAAHLPLAGGLRSDSGNLSVYQLRQWGVTGDPDAKGMLRVRASILNTAAQLQPYPLLRVTLLDRFGTRVGAREFGPTEYLGHGAARMLAPGERAEATLDILDPGKDAEGFEIDVCVRGADSGILCASDAAAPST